MSLQLDVRLGAQEPVIHHLPPDVHSLDAAVEAIELADAYGICDGYPLAESQRITLRGALGERVDGSWAASRVADFGPRQGTGKNDKIAARELAGLILFGEQLIIHTAHEFPTANESFLRLVAVFENWDDLRAKVARIRYANGEQGIELLSGQRLKYRARTGGSGRGFAKADLVVYDEAQHLAREHVAASGPAKLANPNSQTWYAGSGGLESSSVAWAIRRAAILGTGGRLAYTEATAETIKVIGGKIKTTRPDPSDLDAWYRSMPGLGRWVTEESMQALYEELGPELFARECLCVWDPEPLAGELVFPAEDWAAAGDPESCIVGSKSFAFDVSPEKDSSISVSGVRGDCLPHVEIVAHSKGTGWLPQRLDELVEKWNPPMVAVDPTGPAGAVVPNLSERVKRVLHLMTTAEAKQACGLFFDDVVDRKVLRYPAPQPELDAAVAAAGQRTVGDAWLWDRKTSGCIAPLVAATLARWAVSQVGNQDVLESVW